MFRYIRERRLRPRIEKREAFYAQPLSEGERLEWQLERLNEQWRIAGERIPFYRTLIEQKGVPRRFESWDEYLALMPVMTKRDMQTSIADRTDPSRPPDTYRTTGGTTAEPTSIPAWNSEMGWTAPDMWMARGWYGITPSSRLFLIWGHSHLLGSGWRGKVNARIRALKDRLAGYRRVSAYDLAPERLQEIARMIRAYRPDYIIGYSVVLDTFTRINEAVDLSDLGVRMVVATAESFPFPDSAERVERMFGCPVAMEYGAVETHLLAHTHPEGGYRAFWPNYFLEATDEGSSEGHILRITSLYPRCFPLFRFEIGDEVALEPGSSGIGLTRLESVIGRCSPFVTLHDGTTLHSFIISYVVKTVKGVRRFQFVQSDEGMRVRIVVDPARREQSIADVRQRLPQAHPSLGSVEVECVEDLVRTRAGKSPLVIHE